MPPLRSVPVSRSTACRCRYQQRRRLPRDGAEAPRALGSCPAWRPLATGAAPRDLVLAHMPKGEAPRLESPAPQGPDEIIVFIEGTGKPKRVAEDGADDVFLMVFKFFLVFFSVFFGCLNFLSYLF